MSDRQDYTELIARARSFEKAISNIGDDRTAPRDDSIIGMWMQTADALEVVTAERDALRAEKETGGNAS